MSRQETCKLLEEHLVTEHFVDEGFRFSSGDLLYLVDAHESCHDEGDRHEGENAQAQIDRLASFIMHEVPGEPSQSQGAVDTAIRIIRDSVRVDA
jgi:hypothetical protein